jgi:hypothetical protein
MKKRWIEVGLTLFATPFVIWITSFILSVYRTDANVDNLQVSISEMKADIRYIKNFLIERDQHGNR